MALGTTLAQARERAGLTIDDVASATRIRGAVIERIEANNFASCGGDVYSRGHIRSIAKFLGLNPEPLIEDFDQNFADEPISVAQVFEAERVSSQERRRPNWTFAMGAGLVALVAVTVFSIVSNNDDAQDLAISPTPTTSESASPSNASPSARPTTSSAPLPTGVQANADGVTVQLSFVGASWFRVTDSSGDKVFEGTLRAGNVRTFNDDQPLSFIIGNAGAVRLMVNGQDRGIAGSEGEVLRVTFQPVE